MTVAPTARPLAHLTESLQHDLGATVEGALWTYDPLRLSEARLTVGAEEGVVTLGGNVRSNAHKAMAGRLAARVPGVRGVVNAVASDTDIEAEVAQAQAQAPDAAILTDRINLKSLVGRLYLGGRVVAPDLASAQALRRRAEELARAVPGVVDVLNQIEAAQGAAVPGAPPAAAPADPPSAQADEVMQARLRVWRERAAARRG